MKKIFLLITILYAGFCHAQNGIKIIDLPTHSSNSTGGFIPMSIGGITKKVGTNYLGVWDTYVRNDSLFKMRFNSEVFVSKVNSNAGSECFRDIVVDTSNFSDSITCDNASIAGMIYAIYWDDVPSFIYEGTDYDIVTDGFKINVPSFNATTSNYRFHVYSVDTSGGCSNAVTINSFSSDGGSVGGNYSFIGAITESSRVVSIADAMANGTTKGAAAFNANDFNSTTPGLITIDYTNGQAASLSAKGFLTPADFTRFNRLALHFIVQALTPANTVTIDVNSGFNSNLLLNRATTALAFSNLLSGESGWIDVTQDGTGGRSVTLPTGSKVPNGFGGGTSITLSAGAGKRDRLYYSLSGSTYTWTIAKDLQ